VATAFCRQFILCGLGSGGGVITFDVILEGGSDFRDEM